MEKIRQILAAQLRSLRKRQGLTQEKLAERAGLASTHVAHIETGRRWPSPKVLEALSRALDAAPADLFREPDPTATVSARSRLIELVLSSMDEAKAREALVVLEDLRAADELLTGVEDGESGMKTDQAKRRRG